ncbi:MAG: tRNA uridine(34) 5-carboxymethylaminomethyl modification radical SAM/GNAT enzyme Elp3 [Chloroflexi bacterium]|nr:tRNA uridine(34) 5-carboxymethylaminomethyl modification radical SAM/GNAT enzyme Elp3 [Chloroflexota bacterium]
MTAQDPESRQRYAEWTSKHRAPFDLGANAVELTALFQAVRRAEELSPAKLNRLILHHLHPNGQPVTQDHVIAAYHAMVAQKLIDDDPVLFERLRLSPIRTLSGVAPIAVLTGPYPCPGECIFCPEARGFPKSYLPLEPGAQRAALAHFDPFRQTAMRLKTLSANGHSTDKVELLILGATWSAYPHKYQEWFIRRCLDAMNGVESTTLEQAQQNNETAVCRNVGLVVETRPDYITLDEVRRLRRLGVTKVQIGAQSLDDVILEMNKRGHGVEATRRAVRLLRLAGFKLHLHWMPNLLGATPQSDRVDFGRLWDDPGLRPDELKIYPCGLIRDTELYTRWERGEYKPYSDEELVDLLVACKTIVPPYCRINRVIRDIPADYIAAGSTASHLRQVVQRELKRRGLACRCIRCREVRKTRLEAGSLRIADLTYATDGTVEHFLSLVTPEDRLAGLLRLSLPSPDPLESETLDEVRGKAMIREVHVYGPALEIGAASRGDAQHAGLGKRLIDHAAQIARSHGYREIAVISAVGTREYYRRHGFELGDLYMSRPLS